MPARANRRAGGRELNAEVLNAIILKLTADNPAQYDELLRGWEVRRQEAVDAMKEGTVLHKQQLAGRMLGGREPGEQCDGQGQHDRGALEPTVDRAIGPHRILALEARQFRPEVIERRPV